MNTGQVVVVGFATVRGNALSAAPLEFERLSDRHQKNDALARCVRREERGHIIIDKSQTRRAKPQRVRGQINFSAEKSRFQLDRAIAAIAETLKTGFEVSEVIQVDAGIASQRLAERQISRVSAEIASAQLFECLHLTMVNIRSRRQTLNRIDDQVPLVQRGAE